MSGGHGKAHGGGDHGKAHGGGDHGGGHGGGHSAGGHGGGGASSPIGWFTFILIFIGFYYLLYKPRNINYHNKMAKQYKEDYDRSIKVNFSNKYCEPIVIEEGKLYAFSRASVDYCAKNENGLEKCGLAGESVAKYFGYIPSRRTFWFKTSSLDSTGIIYIDFFKLVEVK